MTPEKEFETDVLKRMATARLLTGYSFAGLSALIDDVGAVVAARRLIAPGNVGRFQNGMRVLFDAGLLNFSVEQAVIDFGSSGKIFDQPEVQSASARLQIMHVMFKSRHLR